MDDPTTRSTSHSGNKVLPHQGEKCAPGCQSDEWQPWESSEPSESDECCAPGLVCDKETSTCELAVGQSCKPPEEPTPKKPKKGFLKRKFPKIFGKKKPEQAEAPKSQECAKYFEGHLTTCGLSGRCCVESFDMNNISEDLMQRIFVMNLKIPSPYAQGLGQAYAPPGGNRKHCCSGLGYQWPDGEQACVIRQNSDMAEEVQKLKKLVYK